MSFKDQDWETRFRKMGDQAEASFERNYEYNFERTGWNRPSIDMTKLSVVAQNIPDYMTDQGWVECMGCGRDGIIKLKEHKLCAMEAWQELGDDVSFWFWDSHLQQWTMQRLQTVEAACGPMQRFPEGTPYYEIRVENFDWFPDKGENA